MFEMLKELLNELCKEGGPGRFLRRVEAEKFRQWFGKYLERHDLELDKLYGNNDVPNQIVQEVLEDADFNQYDPSEKDYLHSIQGVDLENGEPS
jgi:hypothetical protein